MARITSPYHPSLLSPGTSHQIPPTPAKHKLKAQSGSTCGATLSPWAPTWHSASGQRGLG